MMEQMIELMKQILAADELFDLGAQALKKFVDALVAAGFSREEAVRIVASQGPMVKGNR